MLEQPKRAIAACDPQQPHAILKSLVGVTRELLEWLWPGRIPLGKLTLLAGDPGLGKSFVTLDMAARVSRGDAWPDMPLLKQTPGNVILLNAEDDLADTIAPRLDKAHADDARILALEGVETQGRRRQFSLEIDVPRLEEVLVENTETRLVVIDPLAAYCGAVDSHKNSDVRGLLAPLAELAGQHRVAIVSVTHLSKSGSTSGRCSGRSRRSEASRARAISASAGTGRYPPTYRLTIRQRS
jgi:RecA-family ATPase